MNEIPLPSTKRQLADNPEIEDEFVNDDTYEDLMFPALAQNDLRELRNKPQHYLEYKKPEQEQPSSSDDDDPDDPPGILTRSRAKSNRHNVSFQNSQD